MKTLRTRALAEGALLATLTAVLGLAGLYMPFIRLFTDLVWPIPIIVVTVRHGLHTGVISLGVAGVLLLVMAHPLTVCLLLLQLGGLALFYGVAFRRKWQPLKTLVVGAGIALFSLFLVVLLLVNLLGFEALDLIKQLESSIEPTLELYKQLGLFEQSGSTGISEEIVRQMLKDLTQMLVMLVPAFLVLWALATAFLNYFLAQIVLVRLGIKVVAWAPFREWRLPWWFVWGFIVGFALYLVGDYWALEKLIQIGMNIILIYAPILFILGLAVFIFHLGKYFSTKVSRVFLVIVLLFFFRLIFLALMVVGLLDLLFDYRHLSVGQ